MQHCPTCGHLNQPDAQFCANCGLWLAAVPAARSALQPGQVMDGGNYIIERPLGEGGMGALYLAAQPKAFGRKCVIKEVIDYFDPTDPQEALEARQRFEAEAHTLAQLKHPGIPDMYGYFSEGGHNYLAMEYIEGNNLAEGLTEEPGAARVSGPFPLPLEEVLRYAIQICEALEHMGRQNPPVVHNDIKPANIIIDENSGRAVLVDFGTAETRYASQPGDQSGRDQPGLYGTVGYAPPELYQGISEARSDVYALAATLYHLLTDDDPRDHPMRFPHLLDLPPALSEILHQALESEIKRRPTATQFRQALEDFLEAKKKPVQAVTQPLTFPRKDKATSMESLVQLCIKHWDYAKEFLYDGTIEDWARGSLRTALTADAARAAVKKYPKDHDAGLDTFIRTLARSQRLSIPAPKLAIRAKKLDFGQMLPDQSKTLTLDIGNVGPIYLYGTISASVPWLEVSPDHFNCPPRTARTLSVKVDTTRLAPGPQKANLILKPADGQPQTVEVRVKLPPTPASQARVKGRRARSALGLLRLLLLLTILAVAGLVSYYILQAGVVTPDILPDVQMPQVPAEEMVDVPAGSFVVGGSENAPATLVEVPFFQIDKYEVSNGLYRQCVEAGACNPPSNTDHYDRPRYADHPVVYVNWNEADTYCRWAGRRLPTEEEWEKAAVNYPEAKGGAVKRSYPWGNSFDAEVCNTEEAGIGDTVPVDSYPDGASPYGALNMIGNVWEWTASKYSDSSGRRVVRGGSWANEAVTSTEGRPLSPDADQATVGFRCARD